MKQWRMNLTLSPMPARGEKIIVRLPHHKATFARAIVQAVRHGEILYRIDGVKRRRQAARGFGYASVRRRLEHKEWVRANNAVDAQAFMAAHALANT